MTALESPQLLLMEPPVRRRTKRDELDRYYTPDRLAWCIVDCVLRELGRPQGLRWLEPSLGGGAFARAIRAEDPAGHLTAIDVDPEAPGWRCDVAAPDVCRVETFTHCRDERAFDIVVGNPPYRHAEEHIRRAIAASRRHVVFLLRQSILGSQVRGPLWEQHPPRAVWTVSPRPSFTNGGTDAAEYAVIWWDLLRRDQQWSRFNWGKGEPGVDVPLFRSTP